MSGAPGEWKQGSADAKKVIDFLNNEFLKAKNKAIREDSGIGIKPISIFGSKRLVSFWGNYLECYARRVREM